MIEFALYALVGAVSGVMAGVFGIGGGLVIVPVLLLLFEFKEFHPQVLAHMAVATSLAAIVFNSLSAAYNQHRRQAVDWSRWVLVPLLVVGAVIGAAIAGVASGDAMRLVLAVFLLCMAIYMFASTKQREGRAGLSGGLVSQLAVCGIGCVSAIVGIAGGTFFVPLLSALGHPIRVAVGTSSALGVPLVVIASISHIAVGYAHPDLPQWSLGYVYLPAFTGIALISPWGARLGVRLAHSLDQTLLRCLFGIFLLCNAVWVLYRLYGV